MSDGSSADDKRMRLRFAGTCRVCGIELLARMEAIYERTSKTVRCLTHVEADGAELAPEPIDIGTPGASARREGQRSNRSSVCGS